MHHRGLSHSSIIDRSLEKKYVDSHVTGLPVSSNWTLANPVSGALNCVSQGPGETQRIGRQCLNSSLHLHGRFVLSSSRLLGSLCRIIVLCDTQTNGIPLNPSNVMDGDIHGFLNLDWSSRYTIVYDHTYSLLPDVYSFQNSLVGTSPVIPFALDVLLNSSSMFTSSVANVSSISDVSYHVICCSEASSAVTLYYTSRFRFFG